MDVSLRDRIKQLIVSELNLQETRPEQIGDNEPLFESGLGLDSLDALQLAMAVEEHFGVRIPEGQASRAVFTSVNTIAAFIERERTRGT